MSLTLAADAAYPFNYGILPPNVEVILGYVGGDTPNVWSVAEINAARATGRMWCGIWTAPSRGHAISAATGAADGTGMVVALGKLNYSKSLPVFYDVENGTYNANVSGAKAAIDAWKTKLRAAGYLKCYAYVPLVAGFDWIAHWTGSAPASLPSGVVGQQWEGNAGGGKYDLSSFDDNVFSITSNPPPIKPPVTPAKPAPKPSASTYTVKASDSDGLIAVCNRLGISNWQAIAKFNGLTAPNYVIKVGQVLKLTGAASPAKPAPAPAAKAKHTVAKNETLSSIAKMWGVTVSAIEAANPHAGHPAGDFDTIWPGDVIVHP